MVWCLKTVSKDVWFSSIAKTLATYTCSAQFNVDCLFMHFNQNSLSSIWITCVYQTCCCNFEGAIFSCTLCYNLLIMILPFLLKSIVVIPLFLEMVPLEHIKTQLRVLRLCSGVTQGLSQLGIWQQSVHQMEDGALTQQNLGVLVSYVVKWYMYKIDMQPWLYSFS